MTVPVVHSLASQHPDMRITMLTKKELKPFFDWMPANVEVLGVDLSKYDGMIGLEKLFDELKQRKFDAMADFHDVLRTKYLRSRFKLSGVKTVKIDKGRDGDVEGALCLLRDLKREGDDFGEFFRDGEPFGRFRAVKEGNFGIGAIG